MQWPSAKSKNLNESKAMTKLRITLIFLAASILVLLIGMAMTFYRLDLRPFDPKMTIGMTVLAVPGLLQSFWAVILINAVVGFVLGRPTLVLVWVPIGTLLVVLAHHFLGADSGLASLSRIGWVNAFLMYFTTVGLISLAGGLLRGLLPPR